MEEIKKTEAILKLLRGNRDYELSLKTVNLRQVGYYEGQIDIIEGILEELKKGINKK